MARVDAPSVLMHALDSVWLEGGSSPRHHGIVVESQSAALGTALTTLHEDFWPRTTSSRLHMQRACLCVLGCGVMQRACRLCPRLRCVALQNAGIRATADIGTPLCLNLNRAQPRHLPSHRIVYPRLQRRPGGCRPTLRLITPPAKFLLFDEAVCRPPAV